MARMEARMSLMPDAKWADVKAEAGRIGVPDEARFDVYIDHGGGTPMDSGYEEIVWSWNV